MHGSHRYPRESGLDYAGMAGTVCLVCDRWWLVAGGWWLVAGDWWLVAGGMVGMGYRDAKGVLI